MDKYILWAVISMMGYGITAIIYKLSHKNIDPVSMSFFTIVVMAVVLAVIWFFAKEKHITPKGLELAVLAGVIAAISFLAYVLSVQIGKVSVATTLRSLGFVVTVIIALLFLAEKITLVKAFGIIFGVIAIILLTL